VVWLVVVTSLVWLGPVALVVAWVGWRGCTSGIVPKVGCFGSSSMVERVWVGWLSGG
jgi:hypothetical protein